MYSVLTHTTARPAPARHGDLGNDRDFDALCAACESTGGIARADDLMRLRAEQKFPPLTNLDALVNSGQLFGFAWQGEFWLPMFQFNAFDLSVRTAHRPVLAELRGALDGWALAAWFVKPSAWLKNQRPLDVLSVNPLAVLEAARTDRFIANG